MEHAYGRQAPFAVGVEEELLLVDPVTHALTHVSSEIVPAAAAAAPEGVSIKHDVYEALAETSSPVCRSAPEAVATLAQGRDALRAAGATLAGAGIHPDGAFGDVVHVPEPRYAEVAAQLQGLLRRTPTCALHVHVGMPDPETAIAVCNRLRAHLPLLQALAAHSPFWHGVDSGFATARAQVFRGYPRAVIPREFAGFDDYARTIDAIVVAGDIPDYTFLYWDIRPHPRLGTVEVRAMDAQARLDSVCGLAALVHALAVQCAHEAPRGPLPPTEALTESSYRAGRDGLAATLWWSGAHRAVADIAADVLAGARAYARDVDAEAALEEVERILRDGNGAARMRAAHAAGGMPAVLDRLVAETAERPATTPAPPRAAAR